MDPLDSAASLADRAYRAILDDVCSGQLKPGERVTQEDLAERLQVSRQPVLQALGLLKRQGFLEDAGRRGLQVAAIDSTHMIRLYQVRGALDALASRLAARAGAAEARRRGPDLIVAGRMAVAAGEVGRLIVADQEFHRFLYALSGNPLIAESADLHWRHIGRAMGAVLGDASEPGPVWDEHEAILAAVAAGDEDRAEARARAHAEAAALRLTARLAAKAAA